MIPNAQKVRNDGVAAQERKEGGKKKGREGEKEKEEKEEGEEEEEE